MGDAARRDDGLFGPDSITWRIHGDPSMLLGGFRALMLQAVHPLVMAGFDDNSFFRGDPWGRLRRTGEWVATVTYGSTSEAAAAGAGLRRLHARLPAGVEPETGGPYRVDDPRLLLWVHCTEVESFLSTYRRSGGTLHPGDADRYVDENARQRRARRTDPGGTCRAPRPTSWTTTATSGRVESDAGRPPQRLVGGSPRRCRVGSPWPRRPGRRGPRWSRSPQGCCRPGPAASTVCRRCRRPTSRPALAGRAVRRTALTLPGRFAESPAHRDALRRVDAA